MRRGWEPGHSRRRARRAIGRTHLALGPRAGWLAWAGLAAVATLAATSTAAQAAPEPPLDIAALKNEEVEVATRLSKDLPHAPEAVGLLGNVYNRQGNQTQAVAAWRRALELKPNDASGYLAMGQAALLTEQHEQAAALLRKAVELDPALPGARFHLAQALMMLGQTQEAIAALQEEVQASPNAHRSHWLLGQLHVQQKQYQEAKQSYEAAIRANPEDTKAHYGLAAVCARLGQREESARAMEAFRRLKAKDVKQDKDRRGTYDDQDVLRRQVAETCTRAGAIYVARDFRWRAEQLWKRAAELDPADTLCRANLATLYQQQRQDRDALSVCIELRALEPNSAVRHLNVGVLHARLGQFAEAETALRRACELAPRQSDGYRLLAQTRMDAGGDAAEALRLARQAVELEKAAPNYFVLGAAYKKSGDAQGALKALQQAMALDPDNRQYRETLRLLEARD